MESDQTDQDSGGRIKTVVKSVEEYFDKVYCRVEQLQKTTVNQKISDFDKVDCRVEQMQKTMVNQKTGIWTQVCNMAGNQMSGEDLMKFMLTLKNTIEKTMGDIGRDISNKINEKLTNLDKGT